MPRKTRGGGGRIKKKRKWYTKVPGGPGKIMKAYQVVYVADFELTEQREGH